MSEYGNAYAEVYEILKLLNEYEYKRIPKEVFEVIDENRNKEYEYDVEFESELKEQVMLPETKAILFNLFRDYLASEDQRERIINIQKEERKKKFVQTENCLIGDNLFKESIKEESVVESLPINVEETDLISKFKAFLKKIFKRK